MVSKQIPLEILRNEEALNLSFNILLMDGIATFTQFKKAGYIIAGVKSACIHPTVEGIWGFIYRLPLEQLQSLCFSPKYLPLSHLHRYAGRNTSFAQMFLDACPIEDFSKYLSRRRCHHCISVHFVGTALG